MKISQASSATLLVAFTEAIQGATMAKYGSLSIPAGWESDTLNALPDDFKKSLQKVLDGNSLSSFFREQIALEMARSQTPFPKEKVKLVSLAPFVEPLGFSRHIVASLEELPVSFRFICRVAVELSGRCKSKNTIVQPSERLRLLSGALIPESFVLSNSNVEIDRHIKRFYFSESPTEIMPDALYLEYRASGYLSTRRTATIVDEFLDEVRAFYGACLAFDILIDSSGWNDEIEPLVLANAIRDGKEDLAYYARGDEDIARCSNLDTSKETDESIKAGTLIDEIIAPIIPVFNSDNAARLKTACAWVLRAQLSRKGLDRVLESAIAIEVLMGDRETSDRLGLTKLIANRCAYALGANAKDRDKIIDFFVNFYRVRSEVVHSGRTALKPDEGRIVNEGLELAVRILKHEISLAQ